MRSQQSTLLRIQFLQGDISNFKRERDQLTDANEIVLLEDKIKDREIRIDENRQWLRVLEGDPGWGKLEEAEGKHLPKMPTFKSEAELKHALEHPENWYEEDQDTDEQGYMATREMVQREHTELGLKRMDGQGPYTEEEPSGPQNDES